jgi:DNA-binding Xre family transcriptional regulator
MAQRWTVTEDVIICKYCIENPWAYVNDEYMDEVKTLLEEAGYHTRSIGAIKNRAYSYELLLENRQSRNISNQMTRVYHELKNREIDADRYRSIKSYIREIYDPNYTVKPLSQDEGVNSPLLGNVNDLSNYIHTIDFSSTFPMVLQKYVDLKKIKKHSEMCKRIGMKPDTFSAILRGKYKEVKKENVLRICVGLELSVVEAEELLESAGFGFSKGLMQDVVVKSFLYNRRYSTLAINLELEENNTPMLFDMDNIGY